MKKILFATAIISGITIAALAALILSSKFLIERELTGIIGARVEIENLFLNPTNNTLILKGFNIYNPPNFDTKEILAHLPEIKGKYNPGKLFKHRKLHFTELQIYMKVLAVTKNKNGNLNVNELKIYIENPDDIPIVVNNLTLTVDEVVYREIRKDGTPHVEIYRVNIKDKNYKDLPSVDQVVAKVLMESLSKTAIKGAAILGVAAIASGSVVAPAVLPVGVAIILSGKDSCTASFDKGYDNVYDISLKCAREMGSGIHEDRKTGIIRGSIDGASTTIKISQDNKAKTTIKVSARKILFPAPRIAAGLLYEISQKIKKK